MANKELENFNSQNIILRLSALERQGPCLSGPFVNLLACEEEDTTGHALLHPMPANYQKDKKDIDLVLLELTV